MTLEQTVPFLVRRMLSTSENKTCKTYFKSIQAGLWTVRGKGLFFLATFRKSIISGLSRTTGIFVVPVLLCSSLP